MNKKTYITPSMEIIDIETVEMLAASFGLNDEEVDTSTGQLSNDRRGTWGNLWSEGDE